MRRFLYSLVLYLLLPLVLVFFLWRSRREPAYRRRWAERFGKFPVEGPVDIWIHAASMGEVQAARTLIEALLSLHPQHRIAVTSFTPAGSARVSELFGERVSHGYLPFDVPHAVRRFMQRLQPRLAVILETELWPNVYHACAQQGIPLLIVSGRISETSLARYRIFPGLGLMRATLDAVAAVEAQTSQDAARFTAAGLPPERVTVSGNIKFDYRPDAALVGRGVALRSAWGADRPVWIAASTHEGEEKFVLDAHAELLRRHAKLLLLLVPRHPQRFGKVAELCRNSGLVTIQRSKGESCTPDTRILLGDTLGELNLFYAAADVAFVGGSLVPVGGHNLLEPAALGLPILTGPYLSSQRQMADLLMTAGAATQVNDPYSLVEKVAERLDSPALCRQAGLAGRHVIEQNQGALARVLARLESYLPAPASSQTSLADKAS